MKVRRSASAALHRLLLVSRRLRHVVVVVFVVAFVSVAIAVFVGPVSRVDLVLRRGSAARRAAQRAEKAFMMPNERDERGCGRRDGVRVCIGGDARAGRVATAVEQRSRQGLDSLLRGACVEVGRGERGFA